MITIRGAWARGAGDAALRVARPGGPVYPESPEIHLLIAIATWATFIANTKQTMIQQNPT